MTPDPYRANTGGPGDPANPGTWNKYAYVAGDPIRYVDRRGLDLVDPSQDDGGGDGGGGGGDPGCSGDSFLDPSSCEPDPGPTPAPAPPPTPTCEQILAADVTGYLASYDGGASPLNTSQNIQALLSFGMTYDVDPRFIVALAVAESQAGTNLTWGPYNAWNVRTRNPKYKPQPGQPAKQPPYTSWTQAISGVTSLIAGSIYFGNGLTTTSTIYPVYQGPNYQIGLGNLNTALAQMSGNQNVLTDPCNPKNLRAPN